MVFGENVSDEICNKLVCSFRYTVQHNA